MAGGCASLSNACLGRPIPLVAESSYYSFKRKEATMRDQKPADNSLLKMACDGDPGALQTLIEFCGPRLRRAIEKMCCNSPALEIDDIFQETWFLLLKDNSRVLRQYRSSKDDLGAFLFGVARNVVRKQQHPKVLRDKLALPMARFSSGQIPVRNPNLNEIIGDLAAQATVAEIRFLKQSLFQPAEGNTRYSQANSRQLTCRLLDKVWPLVYGEDVPRPHRGSSRPVRKRRQGKPNGSKYL